jgi:hypothetical protein
MSNEKKPSGNGYDEDLDIEIKDVLGDAPRVAPFNASPYFEKLAMIMPLQGSRLDWDRVPNARVAFTPIGEQQTADFETFFKQAVLDFSLTQDVIHLSDGGPELTIIFLLTTTFLGAWYSHLKVRWVSVSYPHGQRAISVCQYWSGANYGRAEGSLGPAIKCTWRWIRFVVIAFSILIA